jgi:hypothetical protein
MTTSMSGDSIARRASGVLAVERFIVPLCHLQRVAHIHPLRLDA